MGRPVNKKYFGAPTAGGKEIKVQFHNGTASVDGWIVKQLGTKKFRCSDGTDEAICWLVDVAAASLVAGQMSISVKDDAATVHRITKIAGRKVTTAAGDSIAWNFSDSAIDSAVEMEEGGGDNPTINFTTAVDGIVYEIVVPGTTVFTTFGAADSIAGTQFTMASGPGTGTGTVKVVSDPADTFGI